VTWEFRRWLILQSMRHHAGHQEMESYMKVGTILPPGVAAVVLVPVMHWTNRRARLRTVLAGAFIAALPVLYPVGANAEPPAGRLLAAQCAQCHGTDGSGGFEDIAGKGANDLYNDLREMKLRPPETIMDRQARGYTDTQLRAIAVYLSTLPGRPE